MKTKILLALVVIAAAASCSSSTSEVKDVSDSSISDTKNDITECLDCQVSKDMLPGETPLVETVDTKYDLISDIIDVMDVISIEAVDALDIIDSKDHEAEVEVVDVHDDVPDGELDSEEVMDTQELDTAPQCTPVPYEVVCHETTQPSTEDPLTDIWLQEASENGLYGIHFNKNTCGNVSYDDVIADNEFKYYIYALTVNNGYCRCAGLQLVSLSNCNGVLTLETSAGYCDGPCDMTGFYFTTLYDGLVFKIPAEYAESVTSAEMLWDVQYFDAMTYCPNLGSSLDGIETCPLE